MNVLIVRAAMGSISRFEDFHAHQGLSRETLAPRPCGSSTTGSWRERRPSPLRLPPGAEGRRAHAGACCPDGVGPVGFG
jgi:hypothetical protein